MSSHRLQFPTSINLLYSGRNTSNLNALMYLFLIVSIPLTFQISWSISFLFSVRWVTLTPLPPRPPVLIVIYRNSSISCPAESFPLTS